MSSTIDGTISCLSPRLDVDAREWRVFFTLETPVHDGLPYRLTNKKSVIFVICARDIGQ